ncbi:MAG: TrbI/VirB10 family protein [Acidobacteriia bacterium]|nr:TrbI/VirB10 family protein [Terriglobia bacterium]
MITARAVSFFFAALLALAATAAPLPAQQAPGPQSDPPPAVEPAPAPAPPATGEKITVPAGTKLLLILENGISTRTAKPGDSVYFRTSFPVAQDNRIVIPVGSYLRGEILASKRPGRVKGRAELRLRLDTLIFPGGYSIDLNASPSSADTGGNEKVDREGKIEGDSDKGHDAGTVATTTAQGASVGAIAGRSAKGAGIGAGLGAAAGLAAVLLTRGPEAQLPRGSSIDVVLEHSLTLNVDQLHFDENAPASRPDPQPNRRQSANRPVRRRLPMPFPLPPLIP